MDKVTLVFVGGDSEVDKLITGVTGGYNFDREQGKVGLRYSF